MNKKFIVRQDIPRAFFYCGIIVAITVITFSPSLNNGFTNWDDDYYVVNNRDITDITPNNLTKVFSSSYVNNYQPLTMLTYMVEYHFFQLNPVFYHCTSLLLHIINCLLVFALIYSLSGKYSVGMLVALLFAVHPMRVESVTWIAERKDLLSAFFYFLSLLSYIRYLKKEDRKFYYLCGLSLLFSLLSKPMGVSQPFILLLIYNLNNGRINKKALVETIPFLAIASFFVVLTLFTQKNSDTISEYSQLSLLQQICIPFYGIIFYLVKSILPLHLCAFYPFPSKFDNGMTFRLLASPFLVTGVAFTVYYFRTYSRKLVFGSLYFLITILPVLQIVHVGDTMVAERYTYIPMIGVYFIFAVLCQFLFKEKIAKNISAKRFLVAVVSILLFIFACMTHERCKVWKDSISLWSDIIAKFPVAIAYTNRAAAYGYQGDYDDAIEDLNQAIALNPKYSVTYFNRGAAYKAKGNYKYAIEDFSQAITLNPQDFEAYYRRGISYYYQNDYNHAIEDFTHVIKLNPTYSEVYYNLGIANKAKGDIYRALGDFKKACNLGFDLACKALSGN